MIASTVVNTAARCESNGQPNRIQVTEKTALLLVQAGKSNWLTKREDIIEAKGKGKLQTYWLEPRSGSGPSSCVTTSSHITTSDSDACLDDETINEEVGDDGEIGKKLVSYLSKTTKGNSSHKDDESIVRLDV